MFETVFLVHYNKCLNGLCNIENRNLNLCSLTGEVSLARIFFNRVTSTQTNPGSVRSLNFHLQARMNSTGQCQETSDLIFI